MLNNRPGWNHLTLLLVLALTGFCGGCAAMGLNGQWRPPKTDSRTKAYALQNAASISPDSALSQAEMDYAHALSLARSGSDACVDYFTRATLGAWCSLDPQSISSNNGTSRASDLYHDALLGLLNEGTRFARFDPRQGLQVHLGDSCQTIPIVWRGVPGNRFEVDQLIPVGQYRTRHLNRVYAECGIGLPTIAVHCRRPDERFRRRQQMAAATILLRPSVSTSDESSPPILELYDPTVFSSVAIDHISFPLARDLSAPFAYALIHSEQGNIRDFLQPGQTTPDEEGLFVVRPYERGKIPIVLSHGLISDRMTWANVANEFYARPDLVERFQLWGFEYATGAPFLTSAALLRKQLEDACQTFDPHGADSALSDVVLVGHSMGGLISRLQVSHSDDSLWRSIANRPFDQVHMTPQAQHRLSEACFFEPSPRVRRVVFLGTPHQGSPWAQKWIGRISSLLVREPEQRRLDHSALIAANPGVFSNEFSRRIPTSIDLLEPDSPLLQAVNCLPIDPSVATHSIIGTGYWMPGFGDSDGVVPVQSAQLKRSGTEYFLHARHSKLPQEQLVIDDLFQTLKEHLTASETARPIQERKFIKKSDFPSGNNQGGLWSETQLAPRSSVLAIP